MRRAHGCVLSPLLACALSLSIVGQAAAALSPASGLDVDAALAQSQAALGRVVGDYRLNDRAGAPLDLSSLRGKPWVLSLVYTSCAHSCSVSTRYLAQVVEVARSALGEDRFAVVTVGFDAAADTPSRMRSYARSQGVAARQWYFLSGDHVSISRLAADVGFSFVPSPNGFDHLAQTTVIDAEGRVYRQIYGDRFEPPALVEPLKELVFGFDAATDGVEAWIDRVRLLCTVYDPSAGRYRFDYSIFVGSIVGVLCLGGVALFLVRAWRGSAAEGGPPGGRALP